MFKTLFVVLIGVMATPLWASDDPHYNAAGFFDIHVCNWPEKPQFLMAIFSTTRFDEIERVAVYSQTNRHIGDLNLASFREFKTKDGSSKRAFIEHFDFVKGDGDGWYSAEISLKGGKRYQAKDYVVVAQMAHPAQLDPPPGAEDIPLPTRLTWSPVPGARYYQVFIRDKWEDKVILSSASLEKSELELPAGLLQPGGYYGWRIHTRDSDGNVLLGDFNHGSLNTESSFTIAE